MQISLIVAYSRNNAIGRDNAIPWHLPADLQHFKKTTLGHHIIMGRRTFESIGRALPGRTNVVVTRQADFHAPGCLTASSLENALALARDSGDSDAYVIGGGALYREALPLAHRLYITEVDIVVPDAEVFFPNVDFLEWELKEETPHAPDEKNHHGYVFKVFERKHF